MKDSYLHGHSKLEQERLKRQARFFEYNIYQNINFSWAQKIIEVGCGVGGQTEILLRRFPEIFVEGIDLQEKQIKAASEFIQNFSYTSGRYHFSQQNAENLKFESNSFDGAFLCWILEHVPNPLQVLSEVRRVLRPGGVAYITEVMNSSFFLDPYSPEIWQYWTAFNDYQYNLKGDPFIGAKLGNFLLKLGFSHIQTEVKVIHLDNRMPAQRKEMIEFWTGLLLSASDQLLANKYVKQDLIDKVKEELEKKSRDPDAVFHFTFMQARGVV